MTAHSSSLSFPPAQHLAQWWTQLAPLRPKQFWVGYLLVHRVEALVSVLRHHSLDSLSHFVLRALALAPERTVEQLDSSLHLGRSLLAQMLRRLEAGQVVSQSKADTWALSSTGRHVIEFGSYRQTRLEREEFCFFEREPSTGDPYFVDLRVLPEASAPWPSDHPCHFNIKVLTDCIRRPEQWKKNYGFSTAVKELIGPDPSPSAPGSANWDRVIIDRPLCLATALVRAPKAPGRDRLVGFTIGLDEWLLNSAEPMFQIDDAASDPFRGLSRRATVEHWQQAWQSWCRAHRLPAADAAGCKLSLQGYRLRVIGSRRFMDQSRTARSEISRGHGWILAGEGLLRSAARIELENE
jgi:hypothetical protein